MRSDEERVAELHLRARRLRQARARRRFRAVCAGAGSLCAALTAALTLAVGQSVPRLPTGGAGRLAGSIFAGSGMLGYAVIAILAFLLGVLFTVFCVRLKERMKEEPGNDREP